MSVSKVNSVHARWTGVTILLIACLLLTQGLITETVSRLWLSIGSVSLTRSIMTSLGSQRTTQQQLGLQVLEGANSRKEDRYLLRAQGYLEQAIVWNSNNSQAQSMLGKAYLEGEQPERALIRLTHAVDLVPDEMWANLWLGNALWQTGQQEAAISHWRKVMGKNFDRRRLLANSLGHGALCVKEYQRMVNEISLLPEQIAEIAASVFSCAVVDPDTTPADQIVTNLEAFFAPLPNGDTHQLSIPGISDLYALAATSYWWSSREDAPQRVVDMAVLSVVHELPGKTSPQATQLKAYLGRSIPVFRSSVSDAIGRADRDASEMPDLIFLQGWEAWKSNNSMSALQTWEGLHQNYPNYLPVQRVMLFLSNTNRDWQ